MLQYKNVDGWEIVFGWLEYEVWVECGLGYDSDTRLGFEVVSVNIPYGDYVHEIYDADELFAYYSKIAERKLRKLNYTELLA